MAIYSGCNRMIRKDIIAMNWRGLHWSIIIKADWNDWLNHYALKHKEIVNTLTMTSKRLERSILSGLLWSDMNLQWKALVMIQWIRKDWSNLPWKDRWRLDSSFIKW